MRKLPPMSTIRSFEAAARHLSFSKAADELYVTHGALIRTLEDFLGAKLFKRSIRAVALTEAGAGYYLVVRELLDRLQTATASLMGQHSSGIVNVSTIGSFAMKWLVPRLFRFSEQNPEIDIRLSTSQELANFAADGIDIVIRYGRGNYPGLVSELLLKEELTPVCSPRLMEGAHPPLSLADLRHHTLAVQSRHLMDWI
jgi:LysR family transcriptional regulator, glycine cleavage system transcriptional activator